MNNFKKVSIRTIFLLTIFFLFVVSLQSGFATNITIDTNTEGGIVGAINNDTVNPGDTIYLQPGTYNKTGQDTDITISKNITIKGNGSTDSIKIDAGGLSRIFTLNRNLNVTFINMTFINGNAEGNGGAILNNYENTLMTFINCSFINNTITNTTTNNGRGGGIYNIGANMSINNSNFTNNNATTGGAIYNNGKNVTINNSNFTNNNATNYGGAITNNGNITINNSNFTNNNANYGGAIENHDTGNMAINNSNFTNNNAIDGGAIVNYGNITIINNSNFTNNNANNNGGAIRIVRGNNTTINNSNFTNNNANNNGGAIANNGNNVTINNSNFTNNNATNGGAIHTIGNDTTINNSNFTNNNATNGGAINNYGGANMTINNSNFTNNNATNGGAIRISFDVVRGGNATINNSNFTNNNATNGGAINNGANNITINNSNFTNNTANEGGGAIYNIYPHGNNIIINNSNFTNNKATNYGGAIRISLGSPVTISNSNFINNTANNGGAIWNSVYANIINSNFINNTANNGGAINNNAYGVNITNSNFTNNNANNGGAICNDGNNVSINNSNFTNNNATNGGAIYNYGGANMTINNSNFTNNNATNGGTILTSFDTDYYNGNTIINNSNFTNNNANNYGGAIYNNGTNMSINNSNFTNNKATNGCAVFNAGNFSSINNNYSQNNGNHLIYTNKFSILFLSNNTMNSNNFEKIFNLGLINSTVYVTYLHNNTLTGYSGDSFVLNATLTDDNGNCIVGQNVTFMVENHNNTNIDTFNNGYYYLDFVAKQGDNYIVNGIYQGGNNLTVKSGVIKIEKIHTNNQVIIPSEIIVGDSVNIESILTDRNGNPLTNQSINFYINGMWIGSSITNNNGIAKLKYSFNKSGSYQIFTKFDETDSYYGNNAINSTIVVKMPTNTEMIVDGDKITAILKDKYGNPLEGKEIIFKEDNKVIGSGTTNMNGQVIIYYKDAYKYRIIANFLGDEYYYSSSDTYTPNPINNNTNKTNKNSTLNVATMKKTGIPIILVLLVLVSGLGLLPRKNNKI